MLVENLPSFVVWKRRRASSELHDTAASPPVGKSQERWAQIYLSKITLDFEKDWGSRAWLCKTLCPARVQSRPVRPAKFGKLSNRIDKNLISKKPVGPVRTGRPPVDQCHLVFNPFPRLTWADPLLSLRSAAKSGLSTLTVSIKLCYLAAYSRSRAKD